MTRPGERLRALASRVFDADTMEHLIDPVIADLQVEYAEASHAGRIWRRVWVRAVAYGAVLYVAGRTLRVFLALLVALTALFDVPFLLDGRFTIARALYLVPQALVVAVPTALTLAMASASRSSERSHQRLTTMIAAGAICAVFAFTTLDWWVPSANQAFRVSVAWDAGMTYRPAPGPPEMRIGELRQQMKWATTGHPDWVHVNRRELEFTYYFRWAFPCASLSLALLMISLRRRGSTRRWMLLAALPILFGYYVLMFVGREYATGSGALPIPVYVWMPNAITLLIAAAMSTLGTRRRVTA